MTILDIARHLGLSHTTVSRVLNGRQSDLVSEATRERVLTTARELGYKPNLAARSLRDTRSNLIGVFGSPFSGVWGHATPDIVRGLSDVLHASGYDLFFAFSEPNDEQDSLPAWRFDGAVVVQAPTPGTVARLLQTGQPVVAVNERFPGAPSVLPDEGQGVRLALEHLAGIGHRTVAYADASAWHFEHFSVCERREAFLRQAKELGLRTTAMTGRVPDAEGARAAALRTAILDEGATAVLAYDHVVALDALTALSTLGLRTPQDVSLVCFNDDFFLSRLRPAVSTLRIDGQAMGTQAGAALLRLLRGEVLVSDLPPEERIGCTLAARETSAEPRRSTP